jgi:hypothetical protein
MSLLAVLRVWASTSACFEYQRVTNIVRRILEQQNSYKIVVQMKLQARLENQVLNGDRTLKAGSRLCTQFLVKSLDACRILHRLAIKDQNRMFSEG